MTSGARVSWNKTLPARSPWITCDAVAGRAERPEQHAEQADVAPPLGGKLTPRDPVGDRPAILPIMQKPRPGFAGHRGVEASADLRDLGPPA